MFFTFSLTLSLSLSLSLSLAVCLSFSLSSTHSGHTKHPNHRLIRFHDHFLSAPRHLKLADIGETGERGLTGDRGDPGERGQKGEAGQCAVAPKSAFSAKVSEGRDLPLPAGDTVVFDKILLNEQGDYNSETGRFTCKVPGVYYFAVHATVYRASLQFDLMKNGHAVASYFQFFGNWPKPASLSGGTLIHVVPGDQVWIQMALGEYNGFYSSTKTDSTFSGFLVYSDWKNSAVFA
ncbi:complement C1q tumor necrosis factor-related protein 5 isoform X2 [Phyllopteryx taeniolatus]|uniref:complement C1q tumor necrosis factor-related protein 5 isoform X2 n=1 Tax=Phyllopteryx taeniolatus TaxID=161469 RepID=UPI002AD23858|nr:complement C1q tumor necrosis factor-related protein 5 isoform X2 [Phyllopteryx taeniolatus]